MNVDFILALVSPAWHRCGKAVLVFLGVSLDKTWKDYTAANAMLEYTTDDLANLAKTDNKLKNLRK